MHMSVIIRNSSSVTARLNSDDSPGMLIKFLREQLRAPAKCMGMPVRLVRIAHATDVMALDVVWRARWTLWPWALCGARGAMGAARVACRAQYTGHRLSGAARQVWAAHVGHYGGANTR